MLDLSTNVEDLVSPKQQTATQNLGVGGINWENALKSGPDQAVVVPMLSGAGLC